jgi:hypothetical protein
MKYQRPLSACALVLLAGCTTYRAYDGEPRERDEIAIIVGDYRINAGLPITLLLRQVDGQRLEVQHRGVAVLPGDHTLLVDCVIRETSSTTRHEIEVSVAAGRRYGLTAEPAAGLRGCARIELQRLDQESRK